MVVNFFSKLQPKKKILVLDLDGTLVYGRGKRTNDSFTVICYKSGPTKRHFVKKRPHVDYFLHVVNIVNNNNNYTNYNNYNDNAN